MPPFVGICHRRAVSDLEGFSIRPYPKGPKSQKPTHLITHICTFSHSFCGSSKIQHYTLALLRKMSVHITQKKIPSETSPRHREPRQMLIENVNSRNRNEARRSNSPYLCPMRRGAFFAFVFPYVVPRRSLYDDDERKSAFRWIRTAGFPIIALGVENEVSRHLLYPSE